MCGSKVGLGKGVGFGVVVVGELELETCWSVDQVNERKRAILSDLINLIWLSWSFRNNFMLAGALW